MKNNLLVLFGFCSLLAFVSISAETTPPSAGGWTDKLQIQSVAYWGTQIEIKFVGGAYTWIYNSNQPGCNTEVLKGIYAGALAAKNSGMVVRLYHTGTVLQGQGYQISGIYIDPAF